MSLNSFSMIICPDSRDQNSGNSYFAIIIMASQEKNDAMAFSVDLCEIQIL